MLERASLGVSRRSLFATLSLLAMLCALAIPAIARAEGFGDDTPTGRQAAAEVRYGAATAAEQSGKISPETAAGIRERATTCCRHR